MPTCGPSFGDSGAVSTRRDSGRWVALAAFTVGVGCQAARAHDFWIEPASFRPEPGAVLTIGLRVGDHFDGVPYARNPAHIRSFVLLGPDGASAVPGLPGREPAGFVQIAEPGLHLLGYWSTHTPLELEAERFEDSLKREGLEHIMHRRAENGDSDKPAVEAFYRCAKALLQAGGRGDDGYDRILGLPLELVPERNPYALQAGDELPLRVLYRGEPIEGVRIVAMNAENPRREAAARSDTQGRVRLTLDRAGMWLVKGVHMVPAPADVAADWESAWASLTFDLPEAR